jgi:hypothetical protein
LRKNNKNFSYYSKKKERFTMKAKYYSGILFILLLPFMQGSAQVSTTVVVTNYNDDYDFYYSSRINRFHRSYTAFEYYAPVFTDTYWYNYQPYSWGLSIYGGGGIAVGYSYNYPVYSYGYYDPYFGTTYHYGYNPYYSGYWYTPVVVSYWGSGYNYGWNRGRHHYYSNQRNVYNTYNTYNTYNSYNTNRYASRSYSSTRTSSDINRNAGNVSRRPVSGTVSRVETGRNNSDKSNNGLHMGDTRRNQTPGVNRGQANSGRNNANQNINRNNSNQNINRNNSNQNINKGSNVNQNRNFNRADSRQNMNSNQKAAPSKVPSSRASTSKSTPAQRTQAAKSSEKSSSSESESRSSGSRSSSSTGKSNRR